ncbi:MAG TPA: hypothetical protein VL854_10665, partial [Nitrososphaeraceae archaeon]|nr:hypothetical protein [Nitrososphaeraceae archaeon]
MFNGYLWVIVTLGLFLILDLVIPYSHVFAVNQTEEKTDQNMTAGTPPNSTGIMQNTSGIIDDAIDAIKNS